MFEAYVLRARSAVRKRGVFVKICRAEDWALLRYVKAQNRDEDDEVRILFPVEAARRALLNRNVAKSVGHRDECTTISFEIRCLHISC
jgi:hypothetical protein